MVRRGAMYDQDDLDDGYDDDEFYGEEDYDEPVSLPPKAQLKAGNKQQPGKGKAPPVPAATAGASALARALCDPPPPAPSGKPQPGAKKEPAAMAKHQPTYPAVPPPGFTPSPAGPSTSTLTTGRGPPPGFGGAPPQQQQQQQQQQPFDFSSPSPDAQVLAARAREGTHHHHHPANDGVSSSSAPPIPNLIMLAPSKAMLVANQLQRLEQQRAAAAAAAAGSEAAGLATLSLSLQRADGRLEAASHSSHEAHEHHHTHHPHHEQVKQPVSARRRMAEYVMEPALAREVDAAAEAEKLSMSSPALGAQPQRQPPPKLGLHLVVLGHVDAGKSTLMGRLLHDLGLVSQKEVHKNQKEAAAAGKASFAWAWLLDERPEERARGVTVDVATTRFTTPRYHVTLLDAPGHRDFVPNMISGASQADAALLVVDGSPGGFEAGFEGSGGPMGERGQTREHAQLARSLGVEQLAVVVTKLDTCDYDPVRFASIQSQLAPFLASCGFRDTNVQWLPAVGPSGDNLAQPPSALCPLSQWWRGPTLVQAIDAFAPRERLTGKPLRLPLTDVHRNRAGASVVGGKVECGAVRLGGRVLVQPGGEVATVKVIEVDGQACALARAGDAVELQLAGGTSLDVAKLPPGAMLCHPDFPVPLTTQFEARVLVLDVPVPLLAGRSVTVHAHMAREAGVVSALLSSLNGKTGEVLKAKPRCLLKGQSGMVVVQLERALCLEEYQDAKPLGRVALRDGGKTLAVGVVAKLLD